MRPGQAKGPATRSSLAGGSAGSLTAIPTLIKVATFSYTDFSIAATTNKLLAYTLPLRGRITGASLICTATFAGAATPYMLSMGRFLATEMYIPQFDASEDLSPRFPSSHSNVTDEYYSDTSWGGAVYVEATGAVNLNLYTIGTVEVWLELSQTP